MSIFNRKFFKYLRISLFLIILFVLIEPSDIREGLYSVTGISNRIVDGGNSGNDSKELTLVRDKALYGKIFEALVKHSPSGETDRKSNEDCLLDGAIGAGAGDMPKWIKLTRKALEGCLEISPKDLEQLKSGHKAYVEAVASLSVSSDLSGSRSDKGIVIVGGGKFSVLSLLSIKNTRKFGITLPIEVFIPPQDVEKEQAFCQDILPKENARCIYLTDILPSETLQKFEFKGYQFKALALLTSSFQHILLLDADNSPIKNIDNIFDKDPYKSIGFILWQDYWRRTTNPKFYDIAGIPVNLTKRVRNSRDNLTPPEIYTEDLTDLEKLPFHDFEGTLPDPSTESGQLLINKQTHFQTLLLALYYNVNGPSWYYPILSQKAAGEGDKDTFMAAALYHNAKFYQVQTKTGIEGYSGKNVDGFRGVAMLQPDCIQDYARYQEAKKRIRKAYSDKSKYIFDKNYSVDSYYDKYILKEDAERIDVMFVHSHLPKFDPVPLWRSKDLMFEGNHFRSYSALNKLNNFDIELENFMVMEQYFCQGNVKLSYIKEQVSNEEMPEFCVYITDRVAYLKETHNSATGRNKVT